jgi:hypothetical protein
VKIQPIVEGEGDEKAFPELLRRLRDESCVFNLIFNRPIRRRRWELVSEATLRKVVRLALLQECEGILILFDSDKECPRELAIKVQAWARSEARGVPCEVVIAHCEYEAWLLAALPSLRGRRGIRLDAAAPVDPESIRGAKEKLKANTETGSYFPDDQAALTAAFDLTAAYRACRSFRRMVRAFGLVAAGAGASLREWPPSSWAAEG